MKTRYIGVDLGGTKIKTVILDQGGVILEKNEILTEDTSTNPQLWRENVIQLIKAQTCKASELGTYELKYGISAPGLVDKDNRQILYMPDRLQGLESFNWASELDLDINVINDGHAACIAEYESFYRKKNIQNLLMLTLGTGVGGGIILNGKIFQGNIQRAGHFGHITVDHMGPTTMTNMVGSLEYAIGNFSIKERTHGKYTSVKALVEAADEGNSLATYWWLSSIQKLATGISSLINSFSPDVIVIGGGIATGAGDDLFAPLGEFINLYEWQAGGHQVTISKAQHGSYAGAIGAAFFAKK